MRELLFSAGEVTMGSAGVRPEPQGGCGWMVQVLAGAMVLTAAPFSSVFADGFDRDFAIAEPEVKELPEGSQASFDRRLPPVVPGEKIKGPGGRMRVWSSAGPVGAAPAPDAPRAPEVSEPKVPSVPEVNSQPAGQQPTLRDIDVIIDRRKN